MIAVVDYGMGNLRSVQKALERVGGQVSVTDEAASVRKASKLVVPGVGAFDRAVRELKGRGLWEPVLEGIQSGKPFLGICLGFQLLFERSEEGSGEAGWPVAKSHGIDLLQHGGIQPKGTHNQVGLVLGLRFRAAA